MNAYTGQTYELPEHLVATTAIGQPIPSLVPHVEGMLDAGEPVTEEDVFSAAIDQEQGEPIIRVSAEVVQRLRLGDRELRRRKQRRR